VVSKPHRGIRQALRSNSVYHVKGAAAPGRGGAGRARPALAAL
jgi:hypothetical protein